MLFADLQRNDSECAKISTLLSLVQQFARKTMRGAVAPAFVETDPLSGDGRDIVLSERASTRSGGTYTPALSGGAEQRCAGARLSSARVRMTAMGQSLTNCSMRLMSGITREAATAGARLWVLTLADSGSGRAIRSAARQPAYNGKTHAEITVGLTRRHWRLHRILVGTFRDGARSTRLPSATRARWQPRRDPR